MQKFTSILIIFLVVSVFLNADVFNVIEETEDYLIVEFNLPEFDIKKIDNTKIFIDCNESLQTAEEGFPQLPFFSEIVGIPVDGEIEIQILNKKQKIVPTSEITIAKGILKLDNFSNNENTPTKTFEIFPANLVKKGHKAFIGDRKFCGINIFPFQNIQNTNELIITSKIKFKISIYGDKTVSRTYFNNSNFIDDIGDSFFLNNEFSQKWRKERELATFYPPRSGNQIDEIQIVVDEEGIYKVDFQILQEVLTNSDYPIEFEMAFDLDNIDPRFLELYNEFGAVPINFEGQNDGSFDEGDYFEFFGERHFGDERYSDDFTAENIYTLKLLTESYGSRMAVENGGLGNIDSDQFTVPQSFKQTIHFEEQNIHDYLGAQFSYTSRDFYREDIWFWKKMSAPALDIFPFELQYPHSSTIRHFDAKVCLFGSTFNKDDYEEINHYAQVIINSSQIDQQYWFGQNEQILSTDSLALPIPNQNLSHGANNLYISIPGIAGMENEQILMDYFELSYWREYKTDEDFIRFQKPHNESLGLFQFELENFSNENVFVYKIGASILENLQIEPLFESGEPPFTISFQDEIFSDDTEYYAVTEQQKKTPKFIRINIPSNLKSPTNSAKYIILTLQKFSENEHLQSYVQLWESQGINTKVVYIEDIFDEFNHGIRSVEAVKEFLTYAYNNWSTPQVSHVLILGDGLTDERDNSSNRDYNLVPFRNIWAERRGAIASDNWLGCIVGNDFVPDVSIGRINVWKEEQIEDVVNKSIHYINNPNFNDLWHSRSIFAAGGNPSEGTAFAKQSERIIDKNLPSEYYTKRIYCNTEDIPDGFGGNTTELISTINDGSLYVQFMGHGGGYIWADYNLLNIADISTFNNENYPLVVSLSCYGSAFNLPQSSCIGEELILAPEKGAIAHVGFTGFGYVNADENLGTYLTDGVFQKNIDTIGDIVTYTRAKFYATYGGGIVGTALIHGCALLGDPMISLKRVQVDNEIILNQYNATEGDTINMSAQVGENIVEGKFIIFDENDIQLDLDKYYPLSIYPIDDTISAPYFVVPDSSLTTRYVKLFAYGDSLEITGITNFTVGQSAIVNLEIIPENPTSLDSVYITADFFDEEGISNINCFLETDSIYINMVNEENSNYITSKSIPPRNPGETIKFEFEIVNEIGDTTTTKEFSYTVAGCDLGIQHIELTEFNYAPSVKLLLQNTGSIDSDFTNINLYSVYDTTLISTINIESMTEFESRWIYLPIPILNNKIQFEAIVNENQANFGEINYNNNSITSEFYEINMFEIDGDLTSYATSFDGNLECTFDADIIPEPAIFYINNLDEKTPMNQPDVENILLANGTSSQAYEIGTLNQNVLADSLGHFINDQTATLIFNYHPTDSLTQAMASENNFYVYRWEENFQKWLYSGGGIIAENKVEFDIDQIGIYTILQNNDGRKPYIEANVEGQEFTQSMNSDQGQEFTNGGYISKNGIISFLLLDTNGIDLFNNHISLYLSDGTETTEIDESKYSLSPTPGNLSYVPLKYPLDNLAVGVYFLTLDCFDVNGNSNSLEIEFEVSDEFEVLNFANYPNPVKTQTYYQNNEGNTRFTYVLTDDADKVTIRVYTVSGRLIKTFKNCPTSVGYHEYPRTARGWDCKDKDGYYLANGVYFYRITAKKGNKIIEKTQKMAILK